MYLYSQWVVADATAGQVRAVAGEISGQDADRFEDKAGATLWSRYVEFSHAVESAWEQSETSGARWVGMADLPTNVGGSTRLLGVLAPTQALASSLRADAVTFMDHQRVSPEAATFSLRALLSQPTGIAEISVRSVRLRNDLGTVVVQSENEDSLRSQLADLTGDVSGVTVDTADQRVTLFDDGRVVFTEPVAAPSVLTAMRAVEVALEVPAWAG